MTVIQCQALPSLYKTVNVCFFFNFLLLLFCTYSAIRSIYIRIFVLRVEYSVTQVMEIRRAYFICISHDSSSQMPMF